MERFLKTIFSKIFKISSKIKGKNNVIQYENKTYFRKVKIKIFGNNNTVKIKNGAYLHNVKMQIGFKDAPINNCSIIIGKNSSINGCSMFLGESKSKILIGNDCMFSFNIEINCTDTHSIFDENGKLINQGESIVIGDKVWICKNVTFMKNTNIPNGCIVAQGSIVTRKFDKENCVIAGNPAKVVKENIHWSRIRPNNFLEGGEFYDGNEK